MALGGCRHPLLILLPLLLVLGMVPESKQLQSLQTWSLLQIQHLLNYPPVLRTWANSSYSTDFCYGGDYKTASAFVECYGNSVTQLHIMGPGAGVPPLPKTSSINASGIAHCRVCCRSLSETWGRCGLWCLRATTSPDLSAGRAKGGQHRAERCRGP